MNRKYIGILLFLSFLAPAVTTYVYLRYQKKKVKSEVKAEIFAGIPRDKLVLLKFTKPQEKIELDWEHSKEFEYRGEMYDVVESEIKGDTTYYLCFEDKKETKVKNHIRQLVADIVNSNPQNQENGRRILNFFKSLYHSDVTEINIPIFRKTADDFYYKMNLIISDKESPPAPPPKIA